MADYQAEITRLQNELHDLGLAIQQATATGQTQAATELRQQFAAVQAAVTQLINLQKGAETPSPFSLDVANVGGEIATWVRNGAVVLGLGIVALLVGPALLARRRGK